ncbi:protein PAM68, chloroplastic isoform X2 [Ananas comosus]|uniref:Protein PAM68, chloroplastic isoform X2 n=1 Tax=Ananas comosus TaxID=4615 RepID=A0A6P5EW27_ANACO|nr:protein PAM68, chloroplastic isoform X2 [Ananas comosus]
METLYRASLGTRKPLLQREVDDKPLPLIIQNEETNAPPSPSSMESSSSSFSSSLLSTAHFAPLRPSPHSQPRFLRPKPLLLAPLPERHLLLPPLSGLKSPRGFGPTPQKAQNRRRRRKKSAGPSEDEDEDDEDEGDEDGEDAGTIPEVVTNRMMRRMGLSVGIPLSLGLLFFPFFYYLKVVAKVDVPTWIPFGVSFFFFGSALLGVSYGIVSASWDPTRDGSLLGWNEARRNWPVFWDSLWGRNK